MAHFEGFLDPKDLQHGETFFPFFETLGLVTMVLCWGVSLCFCRSRVKSRKMSGASMEAPALSQQFLSSQFRNYGKKHLKQMLL